MKTGDDIDWLVESSLVAILRARLDALIVACIHDSIRVEAADGEETKVRRIMEAVTITRGRLDVPLDIDFQ